MSNTDDIRSDLEYWGNMWDELEGSEPQQQPTERPQERMKMGDYLNQFDREAAGVESPEQPSSHQTTQGLYHDYNNNELLQEQKSQNPVYPDSVGPDHETTPPVWVAEDMVKEVQELKNKLFDVENRLASKMGGGQKWVEKAQNPDYGKLMSEIESLKKRIEKASNDLGTKDEPSPWEIKRG